MGGRARFHHSFRAMGRLHQALNPEELASGRGNRIPAVAVSLVWDAVLSGLLSRTHGSWLLPRMVADTVDVAYWARRAPANAADHALLVGVPLAVEAGVNLGPWGFAVPAVHYTAIATARRKVGKRTPLATVGWEAVGVAIGVALARYARRQFQVASQQAGLLAEARVEASFRGGQNAVAMGADTVVDLLARTEPLLSALEREAGMVSGGVGGSQVAMHAWKAQLAADTSAGGSYLGVLLTGWERQRQRGDLAADVHLQLAAEDRTLVVTAQQAEVIVDALEVRTAAGACQVRVSAPAGHLPGRGFTLEIDDHQIEVPDDSGVAVPPYEPAPLVLAAGVLWQDMAALSVYDDAPKTVMGALTAAGAGHAWMAHRRVAAGDPVPTSQLVDRALVFGSVAGVIINLTRRNRRDLRGVQLFPHTGGLMISAMMLAGLVPPAPLSGHSRFAAKWAAATLPGFLSAGEKPRPRDLTLAVSIPVCGFLSAKGLFGHLLAHSGEVGDRLEKNTQEAEDVAFAEGVSSVIALVRQAVHDGRQRLERLVDSGVPLDERFVEESAKRLTEAEHLLTSIDSRVVNRPLAAEPGPTSARTRAMWSTRSRG